VETNHAALADIVAEIPGIGKIISIINTKNNDMLPQGGLKTNNSINGIIIAVEFMISRPLIDSDLNT
jgi:hypothetical protein